MKKLFLVIALGMLVTSCAASNSAVTSAPQVGDIVVTKSFIPTTIKNVTIIDVQEDFCIYMQNGVMHTVVGTFKVLYHE